MKKKLKALVGLMALCAVGTIGSAFAASAWSRNQASGTGTAGKYDQAIYLYWGSGESSASIGDVQDLSGNSLVYRYLTVSPKSTKSVSGTVNLDFELAASTDCVITGLAVKVYEVSTMPADDTAAAAAINGKSADLTLAPGSLTGKLTVNVESKTAAHETQQFYVITVAYDGSATGTLGGVVTIEQSFTPTTII